MAEFNLDQKRPVPSIGYRVRSIHPQHENELPCLVNPETTVEFLRGGDPVKLVTFTTDKLGKKYTVIDKAEVGDEIYGAVVTNFFNMGYKAGMPISIVNRGCELWYLADDAIPNGTLVEFDFEAELPTVMASAGGSVLGRVTMADDSLYSDGSRYVCVEVDPSLGGSSGVTLAKVKQIVTEKDNWYPIETSYQVKTTDLMTRFQITGTGPVDLDVSLIEPYAGLTYAISNNSSEDSLIVTSTSNFTISSGSTGAIQYDGTNWIETEVQ